MFFVLCLDAIESCFVFLVAFCDKLFRSREQRAGWLDEYNEIQEAESAYPNDAHYFRTWVNGCEVELLR